MRLITLFILAICMCCAFASRRRYVSTKSTEDAVAEGGQHFEQYGGHGGHGGGGHGGHGGGGHSGHGGGGHGGHGGGGHGGHGGGGHGGYGGGGHHGQGRVQIKTYRGPTQNHGHGWFAPYGFWVRQPNDNQGWGW